MIKSFYCNLQLKMNQRLLVINRVHHSYTGVSSEIVKRITQPRFIKNPRNLFPANNFKYSNLSILRD